MDLAAARVCLGGGEPMAPPIGPDQVPFHLRRIGHDCLQNSNVTPWRKLGTRNPPRS